MRFAGRRKIEENLKEGMEGPRVADSERGRTRIMEAWKGVGGDTKAM